MRKFVNFAAVALAMAGVVSAEHAYSDPSERIRRARSQKCKRVVLSNKSPMSERGKKYFYGLNMDQHEFRVHGQIITARNHKTALKIYKIRKEKGIY